MSRSFQAQPVAESVSVDDAALAVLCDISVHLLLGLLSRELEVGSEKVLGINPSARNTVNPDIIQEKKVGGDDGSSFAVLLLCQQLLLAAEPYSQRFEVVA